MNEKLEILKNRHGFIAALDQSGGSSRKTLANYGLNNPDLLTDEEMFEKIHEMRSRIITSPAFTSDKILGVILFEHTMNHEIAGMLTADYLWHKKKIVSFLKIDVGLQEEQNGVQLLKDIPNLENRLDDALAKGIIGTKMRSVIHEANREGIHAVVTQQFALAQRIAAKGLVPIIEPEVDIYAIEKFGCEQILLDEIKHALAEEANQFDLIFKFTLPEKTNFYDELLANLHVLHIVALSGGYSQEKANQLLKENGRMIASFSRALLEGLKVSQTAAEFDQVLANNINSIYAASWLKDE